MPNKVITISLENWQALDKMRNRIGTEKKYESFNTVVSRLLGKMAVPPKPKPIPAEQSLADTIASLHTPSPELSKYIPSSGDPK